MELVGLLKSNVTHLCHVYIVIINVAYTPRICESDSQSRMFRECNNNENIHVDNNEIKSLESVLYNLYYMI